jgi:hypothetical protein
MRQIRRGKRHLGSAGVWQEPRPADSRDSGIVHAHQVARRTRCPGARRALPRSRPDHADPRQPVARHAP